VICGGMAGLASIIFMARLTSASAGSIGPDVLLNAIAAAVSGGTSLFGGRGTIWSALLGALVLNSVQNGMDLTLAGDSNANYYEYIVKGAILLLAVWLDTVAKSKSAAVRA
jgi:D-xylose transport system permease protein